MSNEIKDRIFTNVVKMELQKEINEVGCSISLILKKYAFFFENDYNELLKLLMESYVYNYDEKTNTFSLDFEHILSNVPQSSKDKLFEQIIDKFSKTVRIADLTSESENQYTEINEENRPSEENNNIATDEMFDF